MDLIELLINTSFKVGHTTKAFEFAEKVKSRNLSDLLTEAKIEKITIPDDLKQELLLIQQNIQKNNNLIQESKRDKRPKRFDYNKG